MTQLTIDLDDETAQRLASVAAQAHMQPGDWVASLVRARLCGEWPGDVRQLAGGQTSPRQASCVSLAAPIFRAKPGKRRCLCSTPTR